MMQGHTFAQESEVKSDKPKIRGAIMMANSHVPNAFVGDKKVVVIPTWGFDVDYFFLSRVSIALQGDIKLQSFEIEDNDIDLVRTNPFSIAVVVHFHPVRHWSFFTGLGYEFESDENFFLIKAGTEYSFEITEDFEIALNLIYENKENVYDAITFGVAFNKKTVGKKVIIVLATLLMMLRPSLFKTN
jgi:hypothetical protein